MMMMDLCSECGAPEYITQQHAWLNNGDIIINRPPYHRLIFFECETIDPLIANIGEIVGAPIEYIVITAYRKSSRAYLTSLLPENVNELVLSGQLDPKALDLLFMDVGRLCGLGNYQFVDMRFEQDQDDYFTVSITEPYSLPMIAASHAGAMEALFGYDHDVDYHEDSPGFYVIKAYPSRHPVEVEERLVPRDYQHRDGDIELKRCGTCGGPKVSSEYLWVLDRGVILHKKSGRRMAISGPNQTLPVFEEMEKELGDTIPEVIVEAQRRFVKTGFYAAEELVSEDKFRTQLAYQGMGNLRDLKIGRRGLRMRLDNATLHLWMVGLMQGIFESSYGGDSSVDWEYTTEGNLEVEVTPEVITKTMSLGDKE